MSKILFVRETPYDEDNSSYNVQGVGIAKAFARLGHDCDYLNFHKTDESIKTVYEYNGHKARVINRHRIRFLRTGLNFKVLKPAFLNQYDYVICREYNQLMTYLFSKKHKNVSMYSGPYFNMFMIPFMSPIYDLLYTKKIDKNTRCNFVKSELAKEFLEKKGYTNCINLGVGLDTEKFENQTMSESTAELVEYMKENECLLYIGTLDENKNIPFLLKVFDSLLKERPNLKFVMIGKSKQNFVKKLMGKKDESYEQEVFSRFPEETRKAILRVERVENAQLQYVYPHAKAFLLPSKHEIFGMVLLEAMYFGAPVVTSHNGGSSTLIKTEDYGQAIEDYSVKKWKKAIDKYLTDKEYTEKVVENCKKIIREQFQWDYILSEMLKEMEKNKA